MKHVTILMLGLVISGCGTTNPIKAPEEMNHVILYPVPLPIPFILEPLPERSSKRLSGSTLW